MLNGDVNSALFFKSFKSILQYFMASENAAFQLKAKYLKMFTLSCISQDLISITTIISLEKLLTVYLQGLKTSQMILFNELTTLLFALKIESTNKIQQLEDRISNEVSSQTVAKAFNLYLESDYGNDSVQEYIDAFCQFADISTEDIKYSVTKGSTDITPPELLNNIIVYSSSIAAFVGLTLSKVKDITEDLDKTIDNIAKIKKRFTKDKTKNQDISRNEEEALPAKIDSQTVIKLISGSSDTELQKKAEELIIQYDDKVLKIDAPGKLTIYIN